MRQHSSDKVRIRKLRAKYRKRLWIVGVVVLIIGFALGIVVGRMLFKTSETVQDPVLPVTPSPVATQEPENTDDLSDDGSLSDPLANSENGTGDGYTLNLPDTSPTSTPMATATPTPETIVKDIVPFGESYNFTTQIKSNGSASISGGTDTYETLSFTLTLKSYMRPEDYANKYASQYKLQGTEAGAGFELILNNYTGTATIKPQDVFQVNFESESGNTTEKGYQLTDAEIAGNADVVVTTNMPKMLYKRYIYSNAGEEMKYLAVSCFNNGVIEKILFELESDVAPSPTPATTYAPLQQGDKSDAVADLQARLVALGYLNGDADGNFGSKTAEAVKTAQKAFGLEETGIADNELQQKLFADAQ